MDRASVSPGAVDAPTEAINPRTRALDTLDPRGIVDVILAEDALVVPAVRAVAGEIARLADVVADRLERGGRLVYVGAGTSGRLGALDAAECPPTFGTDPAQVVGIVAGGVRAMTASLEGAEDDRDQGARDVAELSVGADDVVVGLAASGRTPYVMGAVDEARRRGAFVAAVTCAPGSPISRAVDLAVVPVVGPEVIAGSTRMKSGTAQKLVLNALSTTVMVRLGKTFGNLMVDVQAGNDKLRQRAVTIVAAATGLDLAAAERCLADADGDVKVAIVAALARLDVNTARRRLAENDGRVREALRERTDG